MSQLAGSSRRKQQRQQQQELVRHISSSSSCFTYKASLVSDFSSTTSHPLCAGAESIDLAQQNKHIHTHTPPIAALFGGSCALFYRIKRQHQNSSLDQHPATLHQDTDTHIYPQLHNTSYTQSQLHLHTYIDTHKCCLLRYCGDERSEEVGGSAVL